MKKDIEKSLEILNKGGIILYPADTIWGLGCDATCAAAVLPSIVFILRDIFLPPYML